MEKLDQACELMAEATALLEDACAAAVEGQGANSGDEIKHTAERVIALASGSISAAQRAADLCAN